MPHRDRTDRHGSSPKAREPRRRPSSPSSMRGMRETQRQTHKQHETRGTAGQRQSDSTCYRLEASKEPLACNCQADKRGVFPANPETQSRNAYRARPAPLFGASHSAGGCALGEGAPWASDAGTGGFCFSRTALLRQSSLGLQHRYRGTRHLFAIHGRVALSDRKNKGARARAYGLLRSVLLAIEFAISTSRHNCSHWEGPNCNLTSVLFKVLR